MATGNDLKERLASAAKRVKEAIPEPVPTSLSHRVRISDTTRKRVRRLDTQMLDMQLESVLNRTLPELYTAWRNGLAPTEEVEMALEAVLACWDEMATRTDLG